MGGQGYLSRSLVFAKSNHYGPGHRLHVFSGESLLSHSANHLKYATTAMVAGLLAQGIRVGPGPFANPTMAVLHRLNRDIYLGACWRMEDGRRLTALEVQEAILEDVAAHVGQLPEWAPARRVPDSCGVAEGRQGHRMTVFHGQRSGR